MTASSGEAITISFRGRPGARSFGAPTAGLSTGNEEYALPDGSMLFLTTSIEADRIGHRYAAGSCPTASSLLRTHSPQPSHGSGRVAVRLDKLLLKPQMQPTG